MAQVKLCSQNLAREEKNNNDLYPLVSTIFTTKVIKQINEEFSTIKKNKANDTPMPWYIRFKRVILGGSAACALIAGAWVCHKKSPSLLQRITEKFSHLWNKQHIAKIFPR
jgi:hypothetical protein